MDTRIPDWDSYFMKIAQTVSIRSKDPMTKVGSVIINKDKHIVGTGFNGMIPGVLETPELWQRPIKYKWVQHAEKNAISHSIQDVAGCTLYCTLFPCVDCAKLIQLAGISRVVYLDGKYDNVETRKIFNDANIELEQLWMT